MVIVDNRVRRTYDKQPVERGSHNRNPNQHYQFWRFFGWLVGFSVSMLLAFVHLNIVSDSIKPSSKTLDCLYSVHQPTNLMRPIVCVCVFVCSTEHARVRAIDFTPQT